MKRIFIPGELKPELYIEGQDAHHITRVLRYSVGQCFMVVDSAKKIAEVEIVEIGKSFVKAACKKMLDANTEAPIEVALAQCLPKSDKMDFIVQKAVELGVHTIYPLQSENCVVKYDAAKQLTRQQKWQKIACEAAKQCGRTVIPKVESIISLKDFVQSADKDAEALLCYEKEETVGIKQVLQASTANKFIVLIGAEGGLTPYEAELCCHNGFKAVTLGSRVLRAETASLAAVSVIMYENGDLGGRG